MIGNRAGRVRTSSGQLAQSIVNRRRGDGTMPVAKMRSRGTKSCVRRLREGRLPAKTTYRDNSFTMLRNAVIGGIDLAEVNAIARFDNRFQQLKDELRRAPVVEPFPDLENESQRLVISNQPGKNRNQRVPLVVVLPSTSRRKTLAWRSTNHDGRRGQFRIQRYLFLGDMRPHVHPVRVNGWLPTIDRKNGVKSSTAKAY